MSFLTNRHNQTATLWVSGGVDSSGDPTYASPVAISVRWEKREEVFFDIDGSERKSDHVVYLGQDVAVGDWLFLGTSVAASPVGVDGALQVRSFNKIPSLDASDFERRALL